MRLYYTILALSCSCFSVFAQKPLSVGDTVPDIVFENVLHHSAPTARLSDFKGKLVILDFWATWSTSCLHAFPKMDSLQAVFGEEVKILLVNQKNTRDDLSKVQSFFAKYKARTGEELRLTTVVNDTLTGKLFPHQLLPHYVWIGRSGRLIATTSAGAVTAANIRDVLDGVPLSFTMKKDQDTDRPLFSGNDLPTDDLLNYAVLTKRWFEGLPSGSRTRERGGIVYGRAMANTALFDIYKAIARGLDSSVTDKQLVLATDSSGLVPPAGSGRDEWYKENAYTLEVLVPQEEAPRLYSKMLEVLNQYSGYTGRFEKRKMMCWVLVRKNPAISLQSRGGKTENRLGNKDRPYLRNGNISLLVTYLNNLPAMKDLVVNETGFTGNIDLKTEGGFSDLKSIEQNLLKNGLVLMQEKRLVKVFAVRKK